MDSIKTVNNDEILDINFDSYIIDASNNNITLTLPSISYDGLSFNIKRIDNNNNIVTLLPVNSQLISEQSSYNLLKKSSVKIISNDIDTINIGAWYIFNNGNENNLIKPLNSLNIQDTIIVDNNNGDLKYKTPNNGVVKILNVISGLNIASNQNININLDLNTFNFSNSSDFPKNYSNQFPGQNAQTNPLTFVPNIYNTSNNRFLENQILFQVNIWRVVIDYTKTGTQGNRELILKMINPLTNFTLSKFEILPNGTQFLNNSIVFDYQTITDNNSINSGYIFNIETVGVSLVINNLEITRFSLEK